MENDIEEAPPLRLDNDIEEAPPLRLEETEPTTVRLSPITSGMQQSTPHCNNNNMLGITNNHGTVDNNLPLLSTNTVDHDGSTCQTKLRRFSCCLTNAPCFAIPLLLFIAAIIFLLGVFIGPIWLVCVGVTIAVATMVLSLYLYAVNKKQSRRRLGDRDSFDQLNRSTSVYWYFHHLTKPVKLPTYEEVLKSDPGMEGRRQLTITVTKPPAYEDINGAFPV